MIPLPVSELAGLGSLEARADHVTGVRIDSRRILDGDLFVAVGRGSEYLADAWGRGAAATLVPDDAFAAMAVLGRKVRSRSTARVVGITGSTGKTSTKDILAALCAPVVSTVAAEEGYNNELGLPLTLCRLEPDTEVLVAEMGMRGLGQIRELCELAQPDIAVITGVGPVHLELLGTVENVARAKAEVIDALPPGGIAVVPAREPLLEPYLARPDIEVVEVGEGGDVRLVAFQPPELVVDLAGTRLELEVPFTAGHQAGNTLAALAAYRALGLPLERAGEGAREIALSRWRDDEHELPGGGVLVNDAYNANPVSMRAALRNLADRAETVGGRAVAVLGEMAELGVDSLRYHREIGEEARRLGVDVLVAVGGPLAAEYRPDALAADADGAVALVRGLLEPGDVVLVKASRAAGLEKVAEALAGVAV
jgi:UDP-N-acetylmuramoyl-tripeptide--D-alanyl-D-alanine ligase